MRHLPERVFKPVTVQPPGGRTDSLFEQTRGVSFDFTVVGGSPPCQLGLNLGCNLNGDRHARSFQAILRYPAYSTLPRPWGLRYSPNVTARRSLPTAVSTAARRNTDAATPAIAPA